MRTPRSRVVALVLGCLVAGGPLSGQEARPVTVEDVLAFRSLEDVAVSPDGRWVAYVVSERNLDENRTLADLWLVAADEGEPIRLTRGSGRESDPRWAPDGSWIAFRSDRDEDPQVYGIFPDGGEAWPVTEVEGGVEAFRISPDGARLAFTARRHEDEGEADAEERRGRPLVRDSAYASDWTALWVAPLEGREAGEAVRLSPDTLHVQSFVWAPDGGALAFSARPSPVLRRFRDAAVYRVGVAAGGDGPPPAVSVSDLPGGENPVDWTEESGLLVAGSGHALGTFNTEIWHVPPAGGEPRSLTDGLDENASFVAYARGNLWVEAAHRTGRRLYRISVATDGAPRAAGPGNGEGPEVFTDDLRFYSRFSSSEEGGTFAFVAQDPETPPDLHVSSGPEFRPHRRTRLHPWAHELALGETRVVRWRSPVDGEEIEGVLTLPADHSEGDRVPLLVRIHGGPAGVSTMSYGADDGAYPTQVFAGRGYAVLQPNYRGSTGYGEDFRGLNRGRISGDDWVDIEAGVDHLIDEGVADPERLGVMGWSFGGHLTYWGLTRTGRFAAASAGAGANELVSMYHATDIPEFYWTYLGPKPWEDFALYQERSAYRYVERVTTPLLIQVGENDARVPAQQSDMFYEAMREIGNAPVEMVVYPGQPHGVREPRLQRDRMLRNVAWFARWIPTAAGASQEEGGTP